MNHSMAWNHLWLALDLVYNYIIETIYHVTIWFEVA